MEFVDFMPDVHVVVSGKMKQDGITETAFLSSKINLLHLDGTNQFVIIVGIILFLCTVIYTDIGSVNNDTIRTSAIVKGVVVFPFLSSYNFYPFIHSSLVRLGDVVAVFTFLSGSFALTGVKGWRLSGLVFCCTYLTASHSNEIDDIIPDYVSFYKYRFIFVLY